MSGSFKGRLSLEGKTCDACGDPASTSISSFDRRPRETAQFSIDGKLELVYLCPGHWRMASTKIKNDIVLYRVTQKALRDTVCKIGRFEAILQEIEFQEK